ncbi:MAG: PAS domain S-box protein [Deltaproteobacteria bacterium]|nr:PAS domain S-box protein [Deltaproteobacteria bacterium]
MAEREDGAEKYRAILENLNEAVFTLDDRGCFGYVSPAFERITSYRAEEVTGQPLARLVWREDLREVLEKVQEALTGREDPHEFRIQTREGHLQRVRLSSRRVLKDGQPAGLTGLLGRALDGGEKGPAGEEKYRSIFEEAVDGIFQSTPEGHFLLVNPAGARLLGYSSPEELLSTPRRQLQYVELERRLDFRRRLEEFGFLQGYEAQVCRRDGARIWVALSARAVRDPDGIPLYFEGTIQDVTRRKWAEEQVKYLTFHDSLTRLYNRAFFEEEVKRLDSARQLPLGVILGDVNALKLVNDAFGHREGDQLLIHIAVILRESCRKEDVVARLGGDEFAVFLPKASPQLTQQVTERIRLACAQASQGTLQLSIALGEAVKSDPSRDIQEVLGEAEKRMYERKLMESKAVREEIIASLRRILLERGQESEDRIRRLERDALQIGRALGLAEADLAKLALLAGLHDIGKIATPQGIFIKPGSLSAEEWEIVWKHPEVGYRIASTAPDLAPIAEAILAHHERWDGTGYPRKLKGEEIPLLSRILAVVESYDAMIHSRPFREAVSREQALHEIRRASGSQFDPGLVDLFSRLLSQG